MPVVVAASRRPREPAELSSDALDYRQCHMQRTCGCDAAPCPMLSAPYITWGFIDEWLLHRRNQFRALTRFPITGLILIAITRDQVAH